METATETGINWRSVAVKQIFKQEDKFWLVCDDDGSQYNLEVRFKMDDAEQFLGGKFERGEVFVWVKDNIARAISLDKNYFMIVHHAIG